MLSVCNVLILHMNSDIHSLFKPMIKYKRPEDIYTKLSRYQTQAHTLVNSTTRQPRSYLTQFIFSYSFFCLPVVNTERCSLAPSRVSEAEIIKLHPGNTSQYFCFGATTQVDISVLRQHVSISLL